MPYSKESKNRARKYVATIRARTVCEDCGKRPIEWHREEHEADSNLRISHLASRGCPIERIQKEIDLSTALCRSCHMKRDGRLDKLQENRRLAKEKKMLYEKGTRVEVYGKRTVGARYGTVVGHYIGRMLVRMDNDARLSVSMDQCRKV